MGAKLGCALGASIAEPWLHQALHFLGQLRIIGVTRPIEERAYLLVGEAVDQSGLTDERFAAPVLDFAQQPFKIFLRLLIHRQSVNGVLDRDGSDVLQTSPDFDAQISRFGWQLMNQQQPAAGKHPGRLDFHSYSPFRLARRIAPSVSCRYRY